MAATPQSKSPKAFINLVNLRPHSDKSPAVQVAVYSLLSEGTSVANGAGEQRFPG